MQVAIERWPLRTSLQISGHRFDSIDVVLVSLACDGRVGHGEAVGVYYLNDDAAAIVRQIESLRTRIEAGISRQMLQEMLPPGGARNAVDCALWDLEAKLTGCPVWQIAQLKNPRPLLTTFTCGAASPEAMASVAAGYAGARAIKLKLTGEPVDSDRVRQVRQARPDVWLAVDANQGFTPASLDRLMPTLVDSRVALIEQPFPVGREELLDGFQSPIPIAADETVQSVADLPAIIGRFSVVNVKLDKCGGLTAALEMVRAARELGLDTMVGNMIGTSLAMAPAYLVGQLCTVVDLDGPVFLENDRPVNVCYVDGTLECPAELWGSA
jgi:L-alanine-DL-glutamate epimerase-like enolase superfamily enzyme